MAESRVSVWILGDQLLKVHPALTHLKEIPKSNIRIVMVESQKRVRQLPYHKQKIVLMFSAMRHYAEMLREQGYTVDYYQSENMTNALKQHVEAWQPDKLVTMAAAEYKPRQFQQGKLDDVLGIPVEVLPNTQFLISQFNPYPNPDPDKNYVMENFYRKMRRHFEVLMDGNDPEGGEWNYDKLNRKPLPKNIDLPTMPQFNHDVITQQVIEEVEAAGWGVGSLESFNYAVTHQQAAAALGNFIQYRLENFGPYEDAMTTRDNMLFHAVLSPYVNIGLLEPMQMVKAAVSAYEDNHAPINSVEGFVRQVMGWREYMYWQYWYQMPDMLTANHWKAIRPMPQMFWDGDTQMNCVKHIVDRSLETAYSHHIERLMVVSNFALLAGIAPQAVVAWFSAFYIDAYDWVMQPNVVGMGLNADGGKIATKPYIASANYINKMSDYCKGCHFKHKERTGKTACPFNYLYWNFLIENEEELRSNPRTGRNVLNLRHLDEEERERVQQQAKKFLDSLTYYEG